MAKQIEKTAQVGLKSGAAIELEMEKAQERVFMAVERTGDTAFNLVLLKVQGDKVVSEKALVPKPDEWDYVHGRMADERIAGTLEWDPRYPKCEHGLLLGTVCVDCTSCVHGINLREPCGACARLPFCQHGSAVGDKHNPNPVRIHRHKACLLCGRKEKGHHTIKAKPPTICAHGIGTDESVCVDCHKCAHGITLREPCKACNRKDACEHPHGPKGSPVFTSLKDACHHCGRLKLGEKPRVIATPLDEKLDRCAHGYIKGHQVCVDCDACAHGKSLRMECSACGRKDYCEHGSPERPIIASRADACIHCGRDASAEKAA